MSKLTVEVDDPVRDAALAAAAARGISLDVLVVRAITDALSGMRAVDFLRREGWAGCREDFERYLAAVPHVEPIETDRLLE